jgi:hypothetical protein
VIIDQLKEQLLADEEVRRTIGRRAYEIYIERRGQRNAHPSEDWLRAESEVLSRLIQEMIARNDQAIESHDGSDPVVHRAAEHMQEEIEIATAPKKAAATKPAAKKATGEKPPAKKAAAKAPAKKAAAKEPVAKAAAEQEPAEKKPAAKRASAKAKKTE